MEIRVKCGCGEEECPEWAVVELQGVLEVQPQFQDRLHNLHIGVLCRASSSSHSQEETYTFTIGYHELTGMKLPLKKPLLVLKKLHQSAGGELQVIGIIRHRILFKTRPMALISKPQPAAKKNKAGAQTQLSALENQSSSFNS